MGHVDGGANSIASVITEDPDKWIEALQLRLDLVKEDLAIAKRSKAPKKELYRLQAAVDKETLNRFVYEYQAKLLKLKEERGSGDQEALAEVRKMEAGAEVTEDEEVKEKLVAAAKEKLASLQLEEIARYQEFRREAMKEAGSYLDTVA